MPISSRKLKLLSKRFSTPFEAQLGLNIFVCAPRSFPGSAANVYIFFSTGICFVERYV